MKRKISIALLALCCVSITLFASGCSVKGKTYVFSEIKIAESGGTSEEEANSVKLFVEDQYKDLSITFEKDGTLVFNGAKGFWKQEGSKIYVGSEKDFKLTEDNYIGKVSLGKFVYEFTMKDVKFEIVLKKK